VQLDYVGYTVTRFIYFPSTARAFVNKMREKRKSTSPGAIQVKNWHKTIDSEEELDIINGLEKG